MPTIHNIAQGDADWLKLRVGKVTASELDNLVTPEFALRKGETPHTYLCSKLAEAWRGTPLPGFSSWATEQGQLLEDEARKWYAFEFDQERLHNVGFVEGDDGRCGCSPDALLTINNLRGPPPDSLLSTVENGLTDDMGGLELKCPEPTNHVRYLLSGELPRQYAAQVHMSLFVTGRRWWKFVSYRRGFPEFVVKVNRDEAIMAKIAAALAAFYEAFDSGMEKLRAPFVVETPKAKAPVLEK